MGERRELPQWGPGQSPGRQSIIGIFEAHRTAHKSSIFRKRPLNQSIRRHMELDNLLLSRGARPPLATGLTHTSAVTKFVFLLGIHFTFCIFVTSFMFNSLYSFPVSFSSLLLYCLVLLHLV